MQSLLAAILGVLAIAMALSGLHGSDPVQPAGAVSMTISGPKYSKSGHDITPITPQRLTELAADLTDEEARILLRKGTEPPFCGTLLDNKRDGVYICRLCSLPLFSSAARFTSGTGWPSFFAPADPAHVDHVPDASHGMIRTEIVCARCRGHLGHVFDDGPPPTGRRYCLNSASLRFYETGEELPPDARPVPSQIAYFAGGCFWGVEHHFENHPGVIDAVSGYQGGHVENPTYKQVCTGRTGHAESVRITFDPARVSYEELLDLFFRIHDPTTLNRQGPDVGTQYRSAIFWVNDEQRIAAEEHIRRLGESDRFRGRRIVTEVRPAAPFHEAEDYHQDYHAKHGGACAIPEG